MLFVCAHLDADSPKLAARQAQVLYSHLATRLSAVQETAEVPAIVWSADFNLETGHRALQQVAAPTGLLNNCFFTVPGSASIPYNKKQSTGTG